LYVRHDFLKINSIVHSRDDKVEKIKEVNVTCCGAVNGMLWSKVYVRRTTNSSKIENRVSAEIERECKDDILEQRTSD